MQENKIRPAARLDCVQEYYFSRKGKEIAAMNAAGLDIVSLAIGSPDNPPSEATVETLCREARRPDAHGYQPTAGIPELRRAMARFYRRFYGVELDPEREILPLIGSKEGILHTTLAVVNPGEKVLVPDPGYPTYTSLSRLLGCEVVHYGLCPERRWQPDFEALENSDLDGVRILWTNYPHMPTGACAERQTYEQLVRFAADRGITVVNDNPYSLILNDTPLSLLQVDGAREHCIEFNSMSKSHNMPGWRVGMIATNATFISWLLKVKSNIDSGTFRALQLAAAEAFNNNDDWHAAFNRETYARRRACAEEIMRTLGCTFDEGQVGMFLWGRIPESLTDAEVLTERVLREARVFITPGFIFGERGRKYVRISLCADESRLDEALARIRAVF